MNWSEGVAVAYIWMSSMFCGQDMENHFLVGAVSPKDPKVTNEHLVPGQKQAVAEKRRKPHEFSDKELLRQIQSSGGTTATGRDGHQYCQCLKQLSTVQR